MIIKFGDYIKEAVIVPVNITEIINKLKPLKGELSSLEDINNQVEQYGVLFSYYDEFHNSLKSQKEKDEAPPKIDPRNRGPIKFALYNKYIGKIHVVVDENFINMFNDDRFPSKPFFTELSEILNHEYVHSKQVGKMGEENYKLTNPNNPKEYFSDKHEIMAYANSFVNMMKNKRYNKEEILSKLRNQKYIDNWVFDVYNKFVNDKDYKRFIKYVYMYLEKLG